MCVRGCTNLADGVAICIEEAEWKVGTAIYSKTDLGNIVISIWCCLGTTDRALVVGIADRKLVVVRGVCFQILGFDLDTVRNYFDSHSCSNMP